jgi:hypothetical protein
MGLMENPTSPKSMLVISDITSHKPLCSPNIVFRLLLTKYTRSVAISSCKVHPLKNHSPYFNDSRTELSGLSATSFRYAWQTAAFLYHLNIELVASESSALLRLSKQHMSTQIYLICPPLWFWTKDTNFLTFLHLFELRW